MWSPFLAARGAGDAELAGETDLADAGMGEMWAVRRPMATPGFHSCTVIAGLEPGNPCGSFACGEVEWRPGSSTGMTDRQGYSAGCRAARLRGAIQNLCGRSNRKRSAVPRTTQNNASAPTTPTSVTMVDMVPTSAIQPVFTSTARLAAIGRKKA